MYPYHNAMLRRHLSSPVTDKKSIFGQNSVVRFAASSMQGWRPHQEDEFVVQLGFGDSLESSLFAAVFDGHGGPEVSRFCASNFADFLVSSEEFQSGDVPSALRSVFPRFDAHLREESTLESLKQLGNYERNVRLEEEGRRKAEIVRLQQILHTHESKMLWSSDHQIIQDNHKANNVVTLRDRLKNVEINLNNNSFLTDLTEISDAMAQLTGRICEPPSLVRSRSEAKLPGIVSGSTACVLVIKDGHFHVGNVGDSRCVAMNKRGDKVISFSNDHKPNEPAEFERITAAGGRVCPKGRINGDLNISRTLGDFRFKDNLDLSAERQMVTSEADVVSLSVDSDLDFIVLASDGVWETLSNREICEFVRSRLQQQVELVDICEQLVSQCSKAPPPMDLEGFDHSQLDFQYGTFDNVTVIIVALK